MLKRLLTAAALVPIVPVIYFAPAWVFFLLATAAGLVATWEVLRLHETRGHHPLSAVALAGVVLVNVAFAAPAHLPVSGALALSAALAAGAHLATRADPAHALAAMGSTLSSIVYPGLLIGFQVALRALDGGGAADGHARGPALLVFLYAVVFCNDAAAYFVGRRFGRVRLAPAVSPGKTVEGFLAGVVVGTACGAVIAALLPTGLAPARAVIIGVLLALAAVLGDLSKSLLKRSADVKDSGRLLPGHGGMLDRLDGLLFSSPLLYFLLTAPAGFTAAAGG